MGNLAHNYLPLLEYPLDNKNESSWVLKNVRPGFMIWNNSKIYSLKIVLISLFEKRRKSAEARRPMMICSHCRANNADDANFCQQCGKRLGTTGLDEPTFLSSPPVYVSAYGSTSSARNAYRSIESGTPPPPPPPDL